METDEIIATLWDAGWLHRDTVKLGPADSDAALLELYVASPAFNTTFIPDLDKKRTPNHHGPFCSEDIHASDYVSLQETELVHYLESVELSFVLGEDEAARAKIVPHLASAFRSGRRCYVLRLDERNVELIDDLNVFSVFRELLFMDDRHETLERFIIGFD